MKKRSFILSTCLLLIAGVALSVFLLRDDDVSSSETNVAESAGKPAKPKSKMKKKAPSGKVKSRIRPSAVKKDRKPMAVDAESEFSPAEQKVVDAIQDALDNEDLKKVAAQLKVAAASTNAAVRVKAVEALQWFGSKALPELTMFMADDDDDVRTSAVDAWNMGISEMEASDEKARALTMGLSAVTDTDQLEMMVMQVDDMNDFQKLDVLTKVIEGGNKTAAEVAREHYKFWTDEDYTDLPTAQKWLDAKVAEEAATE